MNPRRWIWYTVLGLLILASLAGALWLITTIEVPHPIYP